MSSSKVDCENTVFNVGTIPMLQQHIFGLFLTHSPTRNPNHPTSAFSDNVIAVDFTSLGAFHQEAGL